MLRVLSSAHRCFSLTAQWAQGVVNQSHRAPNEGGVDGSPDLVPHCDADSINAAEDIALQSDSISVGSWADVVLVEETAGDSNADAVYSCSRQDWGELCPS
jgi:hypothetical protein